MSKKTPTTEAAARRFRVGDKVSFRIAGRQRVARIIEDRGHIGRGGRQLLRVVYIGPGGQFQEAFEVPADDVTLARPSHRNSARSKRNAVTA
jgi:hypothetical protein